jgi:hypothetical protein
MKPLLKVLARSLFIPLSFQFAFLPQVHAAQKGAVAADAKEARALVGHVLENLLIKEGYTLRSSPQNSLSATESTESLLSGETIYLSLPSKSEFSSLLGVEMREHGKVTEVAGVKQTSFVIQLWNATFTEKVASARRVTLSLDAKDAEANRLNLSRSMKTLSVEARDYLAARGQMGGAESLLAKLVELFVPSAHAGANEIGAILLTIGSVMGMIAILATVITFGAIFAIVSEKVGRNFLIAYVTIMIGSLVLGAGLVDKETFDRIMAKFS